MSSARAQMHRSIAGRRGGRRGDAKAGYAGADAFQTNVMTAGGAEIWSEAAGMARRCWPLSGFAGRLSEHPIDRRCAGSRLMTRPLALDQMAGGLSVGNGHYRTDKTLALMETDFVHPGSWATG
jgi:hypothetical protein